MLYKEYEKLKAKYLAAQNKFDDVINELERLFINTQPKSTQYGKINSSPGIMENPFDKYIIKKDPQLEHLNNAKIILEERKYLLDLKEEELRKSKNWLDVIYVNIFIDRISVRILENRIPFSRADIYRKINIIKKSLRQNETNDIVK